MPNFRNIGDRGDFLITYSLLTPPHVPPVYLHPLLEQTTEHQDPQIQKASFSILSHGKYIGTSLIHICKASRCRESAYFWNKSHFIFTWALWLTCYIDRSESLGCMPEAKTFQKISVPTLCVILPSDERALQLQCANGQPLYHSSLLWYFSHVQGGESFASFWIPKCINCRPNLQVAEKTYLPIIYRKSINKHPWNLGSILGPLGQGNLPHILFQILVCDRFSEIYLHPQVFHLHQHHQCYFPYGQPELSSPKPPPEMFSLADGTSTWKQST